MATSHIRGYKNTTKKQERQKGQLGTDDFRKKAKKKRGGWFILVGKIEIITI